METYELIAQLQREISGPAGDLKAEALLVIALANGLSEEDFSIACDSLFGRPYRKDILTSDIKEDAARKDFLEVHLNRNGLYDQLPEGLFYQPVQAHTVPLTARDMALESRLKKQREREIRQFFMPFENAFFQQRLRVEQEEARLLAGLHSGTLHEYLARFWGIPDTLPPARVASLLELVPYASQIAGDLRVTERCLEKILGEKVRVRLTASAGTPADAGCVTPFGQTRLGLDMVVGNRFAEAHPRIVFTIGPLRQSFVADYLSGGNQEVFLNTFYGFFVPVEAEVITQIEMAPDQEAMTLRAEEAPVLGFSSVL